MIRVSLLIDELRSRWRGYTGVQISNVEAWIFLGAKWLTILLNNAASFLLVVDVHCFDIWTFEHFIMLDLRLMLLLSSILDIRSTSANHFTIILVVINKNNRWATSISLAISEILHQLELLTGPLALLTNAMLLQLLVLSS